MPQLVDEHEQAEPQDRDEDRHAGDQPSLGGAARLGVGRDELVEITAGAPSTRSSASATVAAISENPIRPSRNAATATSLAAL